MKPKLAIILYLLGAMGGISIALVLTALMAPDHLDSNTCNSELLNTKAHLERVHIQLFDCHDELTEFIEHHICDDKQLAECQRDYSSIIQEIEDIDHYSDIIKALEVKNND